MARETTITQEQVNATADAIRAAGARPTARAVRESLGGGSMATVLKFLQAWQAGQVRTADAPVTLPTSLQRALVDFIGQEVATAKAEIGQDLAAMQQANTDLIAESERQAATIEAQIVTLETFQAEKAELVGRLAQIESALAKAGDEITAERAAAERARTELAKAELRLEALPRIENDLAEASQAFKIERDLRVIAEQESAVALAKLEAMSARAAAAEAATEKAEKRAAQTTQELSSARVQVQAQQTALDTAARECDELRKQTKDARAEAKKAGEVAAELRGKLAAQPKAKPSKPSSAAPKD